MPHVTIVVMVMRQLYLMEEQSLIHIYGMTQVLKHPLLQLTYVQELILF